MTREARLWEDVIVCVCVYGIPRQRRLFDRVKKIAEGGLRKRLRSIWWGGRLR